MTAARPRRPVILVAAFALVAGACTHIQTQPGQTIRLDVVDASGQPATGVECRLGNARGTWSMVAPGDVRVSTAPSELTVTCLQPGAPAGHARLLAATVPVDPERLADPGYVNVLFDPIMNPSTRYAERVTVILGRVTVVDINSQRKPAAGEIPAPSQPAPARPLARR